MSPIWKDKWTAALRSGKYRQIQGQLSDGEGGYCCLGVLCDIYDSSQWDESKTMYGETRYYSQPPNSLVVAVGLPHNSLGILLQLNDTEGAPFDRIAKYIEEKL